MSQQIQIDIPHFKKGAMCNFAYWIITEDESSNLLNDKEFIFIPNLHAFGNVFITSLMVQYCETDTLLTYNYQDSFYTVPKHEEECYGVPIFKDTENYCEFEDIKQFWYCPQNFFTSRIQAQNMLDLLKKKYGSFIGDAKDYTYISPYGHFN